MHFVRKLGNFVIEIVIEIVKPEVGGVGRITGK